MTLSDLLCPECVLVDVKAENQEEVIHQLYKALLSQNKVRTSFYDAVIAREKEYPTGLELGKWNVAIPHVVPQHVLSSALGIAVLEKPVAFYRMDDSSETVNAKVVFNIALGQEGKQIEVLQKIMGIVTNADVMDQIVQAGSPEKIIDILRKEDV